jgi:hypothetical protein
MTEYKIEREEKKTAAPKKKKIEKKTGIAALTVLELKVKLQEGGLPKDGKKLIFWHASKTPSSVAAPKNPPHSLSLTPTTTPHKKRSSCVNDHQPSIQQQPRQCSPSTPPPCCRIHHEPYR